jgi:hypothetical protein
MLLRMTTYDFGFHHDLVFVCELVLWHLLTELVFTLLLVSYLTCFVASGLFPPCSSLSHLRCVVVRWDEFYSSLGSHLLMALTLVTRLSAPLGDTDKVCSSAMPTKLFLPYVFPLAFGSGTTGNRCAFCVCPDFICLLWVVCVRKQFVPW